MALDNDQIRISLWKLPISVTTDMACGSVFEDCNKVIPYTPRSFSLTRMCMDAFDPKPGDYIFIGAYGDGSMHFIPARVDAHKTVTAIPLGSEASVSFTNLTHWPPKGGI